MVKRNSKSATTAVEGKYVTIGIPDLDGSLRGRRLGRDAYSEFLANGAAFADVILKWDASDSVFTEGPFRSEPIAVDSGSSRPNPFEPSGTFVLGDFTGPSREVSPRNALISQIERARKLGFTAKAAFEFEWLVFEETAQSLRQKSFENLTPFAPDNRCWDLVSAAGQGDVISGLQTVAERAEISLAGLGMELGRGCMEATLGVTDALRAADDAAFFKLVTKAYFRSQDRSACFMAQSDAANPGLSGHINLSLTDSKGKNTFRDAKGQMTEMALHFIGGVLKLLPDALPLCAHTVNSYRRMSPGNWAPRTATWSIGGYTTAVRAVPGNHDHARLEFRIPGADVNPWLGLTMFLGAGLYGIENKIKPPAPVSPDGNESAASNVVTLPRDLLEATERLASSKIARKLYGEEFIDRFCASRRHEFNALRRAVSVMEKTRYFEAC